MTDPTIAQIRHDAAHLQKMMTRKEAIRVLTAMAVDLTGALGGAKGQQIRVMIKQISAIDAALAALAPKWISVEDRLPEREGKYIVCTAKNSVYCTRWNSRRFGTDLNTQVTHWMPLPEPPKEDER